MNALTRYPQETASVTPDPCEWTEAADTLTSPTLPSFSCQVHTLFVCHDRPVAVSQRHAGGPYAPLLSIAHPHHGAVPARVRDSQTDLHTRWPRGLYGRLFGGGAHVVLLLPEGRRSVRRPGL